MPGCSGMQRAIASSMPSSRSFAKHRNVEASPAPAAAQHESAIRRFPRLKTSASHPRGAEYLAADGGMRCAAKKCVEPAPGQPRTSRRASNTRRSSGRAWRPRRGSMTAARSALGASDPASPQAQSPRQRHHMTVWRRAVGGNRLASCPPSSSGLICASLAAASLANVKRQQPASLPRGSLRISGR